MSIFRRRLMMPQAEFVPPYDAEIEYLETRGDCYIRTTCVPSGANIAISTKFMLIGYTSPNSYQAWYEAYTSDSVQCYRTTRYSSQICISNGSRGERPASDPRFSVSNGNIYEIETDGTSVSVNGTEKTTRVINGTRNTAAMTIFSSTFKGRCYYFKIYDNGRRVLDCIPVRVGNTGYLYDKVSRQLLGNSGTGELILGNDVI